MAFFKSPVFRSLWYDRWIHVAVLFGVLCATAVLTGALLVGDSMRGSLRDLTLNRLGRIDTILLGSRFFAKPRGDLLPPPWTETVPGVLLPGAAEFDAKISGTQILGLETSFDAAISIDRLGRDEAMINRTLADRLGVGVGETVSLRLASPQSIPAESSLGRRNDLVIRTRITIREIMPDRGLGRFSLQSDQQAEPLVVVPLDRLQRNLGVGEKVNAIFFLTDRPETVSDAGRDRELRRSFRSSPDDLGIVVERDAPSETGAPESRYYVKSDRVFFSGPQTEALRRVLPDDAEAGLLYLATSIRAVKNGRTTPYSTVYGCRLSLLEGDRSAGLFGADAGRSSERPTAGAAARPDVPAPVVLNRWTADDLEVDVGDEIELSWFPPDDVRKIESRTFRLAAILPMHGIGADPRLVPDVKGLTDETTIADWDPPFPFDATRIRKKDEDYWDVYRAAPKAFVPLEIARTCWGSRFGDTTTFSFRAQNAPFAADVSETGLDLALFGLNFLPVKRRGLEASAGTTPFSALFLSFSFFIIASALMLVMMLFRLSVEIKARRIGIRLAVGWTPGRIRRLLLLEGFVIASAGSLLGTLFGLSYARILVYGLTTWWVDAVTVPFLTLHISPRSLVLGLTGGVTLALLSIAWTLRGIGRASVKTLLDGDFDLSFPAVSPANRRRTRRAGGIAPTIRFGAELGALLGCAALAARWGNGDAVPFFLLGALALLSGLWRFRTKYVEIPAARRTAQSLIAFADSNGARNRGRSLLFIGLVASTTFLVLSIGAFRLDPAANMIGDGGFAYLGETAMPVYHSVETPEGREALGIQDAENELLARIGFDALSFRASGGDDASCLNLYQAGSPRVLGVPEKIDDGNRFRFAKSDRLRPDEKSAWSALRRHIRIDSDGATRVPIVLDVNTAMYALHLYGGIGDVYELHPVEGKTVRCEVVGLLSNSVLQGGILMGERNFMELFPEFGGYRFFLFTDRGSRHGLRPIDGQAAKILYDLLGDHGFQGEAASDRLRKLFAVQNTYLSTFQSLGGIGILLGVFGLAVIQLRSVLQRRRELALMQAIGFSRRRIVLLLSLESGLLLFRGLGLALFASIFVLLPFLFGSAPREASPTTIAVPFAGLGVGLTAAGLISGALAARSVLRIPVARELAEER